MSTPSFPIPFLDLNAQYLAYKSELDAAVAGVISSARFVQGPEVEALESELASYVGVAHCVSCASGTDALYLALRALGVGAGDEVIVPGFSFFATAGSVELVGARPVFVDIEPATYNMDPAQLERACTRRTRAIMPVGLYGHPPQIEAIAAFAATHGVAVVEDAAQSFGAVDGARRSCGDVTVACTSFYPAKPLGSFGEGGAVFTDDDALAATLRQLMNQGQRASYDHALVGINGRMHALQAAVLRVKLRHFDDELARRRAVAERYRDGLADVDRIVLPEERDGCRSSHAQFTIRVDERDELRAFLRERGVPTAVHYPKPMYRQDALAGYGSDWVRESAERCPVCELAAGGVLSLPFGPFMRDDDQDHVIRSIAGWRGGES